MYICIMHAHAHISYNNDTFIILHMLNVCDKSNRLGPGNEVLRNAGSFTRQLQLTEKKSEAWATTHRRIEIDWNNASDFISRVQALKLHIYQ